MNQRERAAIIIAGNVSWNNDELDVDGDARTSECDEGIWVAAWVFISNNEINSYLDGNQKE